METRCYADYISSRGHFDNIQNIIGTPPARRKPFYHSPLGYYSNPRSIIISGTPLHRFVGPIEGQFQSEVASTVGPTQAFDFELELGMYIGKPSRRGYPIKLADVDEHLFGFVLLNDWSARDIQAAESGGPTSPFLAKSAGVTVSPWIVTLDALKEARMPRLLKAAVPLVKYLTDEEGDDSAADIRCWANWRREGRAFRVCEAEFGEMYWTYRQLIAHMTRNGCEIGVGDLIGTGTTSKLSDDMGRACLFERNYNGSKEIDFGDGDKRKWLLDGDNVSIYGTIHHAKTGEKLMGFGSCVGKVIAH